MFAGRGPKETSERMAHRILARGAMALWAACWLGACLQGLPAELPSDESLLYYPGALIAPSGGHAAYVVNTNFDQRFDTGWLTRVDLDVLGARLAAGSDLRPALQRGLKVPSLGGDAALSTSAHRAWLTHRGSGYVSVLDVSADGTLSCGTPGGARALGGYLARTDCDEAHLFDLKSRLAEQLGVAHRPERERLDDPLALVDAEPGAALVAFLADQRIVSLSDATDGRPSLGAMRLSGPGGARYHALSVLPDGSLLACGQTGPGSDFGMSEALLSYFPVLTPYTSVLQGVGAAQHLFPSRLLSDGRAFDRAAASLGRAAAAPAADGRIFVLSRGPEGVLALAPTLSAPTRLDAQGALSSNDRIDAFALTEAYAVPGVRLTDVLYLPRSGGDLLVASSLERDALYFFDTTGPRLQLVQRMRIGGRGPYRMLQVEGDSRPLLLVSTFYDHGLTVVDLSPTSAADFVSTSFVDATYPSHLTRP